MNEFRKKFYDATEIIKKYPEKRDLLKQTLGI